MSARYEIKKTSDRQYLWNLKAGNHEIILTSERYTTKAAAEKGIESCRVNSPIDSRYDRRTATNGKPYFVLRAGNHEVIGKSELYNSEQARDNGIASCKTNGPTAPVVDLTAQAAGAY